MARGPQPRAVRQVPHTGESSCPQAPVTGLSELCPGCEPPETPQKESACDSPLTPNGSVAAQPRLLGGRAPTHHVRIPERIVSAVSRSGVSGFPGSSLSRSGVSGFPFWRPVPECPGSEVSRSPPVSPSDEVTGWPATARPGNADWKHLGGAPHKASKAKAHSGAVLSLVALNGALIDSA